MSALHVDAVTLADELETGLALRLSLITRWKMMGALWVTTDGDWSERSQGERTNRLGSWTGHSCALPSSWPPFILAIAAATRFVQKWPESNLRARHIPWVCSCAIPESLPALYPCAHSPDVRELRLHRANMTTKDEMGGKGSPLPFLRQQNSRESSTILGDPGRPEPWFPWEQPVWGHALLLACPPSVFSLQSLILALGITIQVLRPFAQALASGSFSGFLLSWRLAEYGLVVRDRKQAEMTPEFLVLWLNRCEDHSLIREYRRRWSVWVS